MQILRQIVEIIVEGHKALGAATEGNLVVAIVPPVVHLGAPDGVLEGHHVVDLSPAMLTDPAIGASAIGIKLRRDDALLGILRRRLVAVVEAKGAHHLADAVGIGQMEGGGHFVLLGRLVVELLAAVALIVVIVHKGERLIGGQESPVGAPARKPFQRVVAAESLADFLRETELGDGSQWRILITRDSLVAMIDDLLVDEGTCIVGEAMVCVQVARVAVNILKGKLGLNTASITLSLTSRSVAAMCLAASTRKPATPSVIR